MPLTRWPCRSLACFVKLTTLMARIGNTHGIRLRIKPPSSAPSKAARSVGDASGVAATGGAPVAVALLPRKAACDAGDTPAAGAMAGQAPSTFASVRHAAPPDARTTGIKAGL